MSTETELQTRPVGRPCQTCADSRRAEIEEAMVSGDSLSRISRNFGIERSALDRHRSRHLAWTAELAKDAGLTPESVVDHLLSIAVRLTDDAIAAWESGTDEQHRKAELAASRAWSVVGAVSGNNAQALASTVEHQRVQIKAMAALMHRHPQVLDAYTRELERQDAPLVAEAIRKQFPETNKEIES